MLLEGAAEAEDRLAAEEAGAMETRPTLLDDWLEAKAGTGGLDEERLADKGSGVRMERKLGACCAAAATAGGKASAGVLLGRVHCTSSGLSSATCRAAA